MDLSPRHQQASTAPLSPPIVWTGVTCNRKLIVDVWSSSSTDTKEGDGDDSLIRSIVDSLTVSTGTASPSSSGWNSYGKPWSSYKGLRIDITRHHQTHHGWSYACVYHGSSDLGHRARTFKFAKRHAQTYLDKLLMITENFRERIENDICIHANDNSVENSSRGDYGALLESVVRQQMDQFDAADYEDCTCEYSNNLIRTTLKIDAVASTNNRERLEDTDDDDDDIKVVSGFFVPQEEPHCGGTKNGESRNYSNHYSVSKGPDSDSDDESVVTLENDWADSIAATTSTASSSEIGSHDDNASNDDDYSYSSNHHQQQNLREDAKRTEKNVVSSSLLMDDLWDAMDHDVSSGCRVM